MYHELIRMEHFSNTTQIDESNEGVFDTQIGSKPLE